MKKRKIYRHNAALVAVLCLIFTAGLLTASTLALSQIGTFSVASHVELQRSMLVAEGAATRIQYLLAADRNLHQDDVPGEVDYSSFEYDRYMADAVEHTIDYYGETISFTITDAVSGWNMSSTGFEAALQYFSGQEEAGDDLIDLVTRVSQRLGDYVDSDDDIQDYGMEITDYEDQGQAPLPRNAPMQFREELLYIDGFTDLFPLDGNGRLSLIRLIPPENTSDLSDDKMSLFTADRQTIDLLCELSEDQLDAVMESLRRWKVDRELLSDTLDEDVLAILKNSFSTKESGAYTVIIQSPADRPRPFRKLVFSYAGFEVSGPEGQIINYMEWNFL
ncbi:MAG: general secretion pathway protein GspK [Lentisphaerae bacterium]|nr:general secretion pathway protein GspK [Lentisphaerota bacterium]